MDHHWGRCRHLLIDYKSSSVFIYLLGRLQHIYAPHLKSIGIRRSVHHLFDDDITNSLQIFTPGAPALTHVHISGVRLDCCLPPLGAASHLSLYSRRAPSYILAGKFRDILSSTSSLVSLDILGKIVDEWTPSRATVTLPFLRAISLEAVSSHGVERFTGLLDLIHPPSLEILSIGGWIDTVFFCDSLV